MVTHELLSLTILPFFKAYWSSASQEIFCILKNTEVHYYVHQGLSLVPIFSQVISVCSLHSCFFDIY